MSEVEYTGKTYNIGLQYRVEISPSYAITGDPRKYTLLLSKDARDANPNEKGGVFEVGNYSNAQEVVTAILDFLKSHLSDKVPPTMANTAFRNIPDLKEISLSSLFAELGRKKATLPLSTHRILSKPFHQPVKAAIPISIHRAPAKLIERRKASIPISVHRARASPVLLPEAIVSNISPEEKEPTLQLEKRKRERLRA